MNDLIIKTDEASLQDTVNNFIALVEEVPWGNSDWQNQQTIINRELTPERAYRHASIRIMNRFEALKETYYSIQKNKIEIKKLERLLAAETDELEHELLQLEIQHKTSGDRNQEKLIKDAIREIESLAPVILAMGKLSREQFEQAEAKHFELKYRNQVMNKSDSLLGLEAMGVDIQTGEMKQDYQSLFEQIKTKLLDEGKS